MYQFVNECANLQIRPHFFHFAFFTPFTHKFINNFLTVRPLCIKVFLGSDNRLV